MTSGYHHYQMDYLNNNLSLDTRRTPWLDDDDSSILDDNILDSNNLLDSALDMSPIDRRRSSLLDSNTIFSPSNEWDFDHDMGIAAGPADDSAPIPAATFEHSSGTNNPFIKLEQQAQPAYAQQNGSWATAHVSSGSCTPAVYDNNAFPNAQFEDGASYMAPSLAAAGPAGAYDSNIHITPHAVFQTPSVASMPASPAVKDWSQAGSADHNDGQPMAKRMRPNSPAARAHSPLHVVRRDGIRKKNARFDIPAERTLMNIDQLIARSNDDNEIKELKQQKRLLRNRQAALDSRQRKKQHTERLEEEKKVHSAVIQELEEKLQHMTMQEEQLHQRLEFLHHKAETLQMEKEEMVRNHTLETGDLRKRNTYLQEQLQKMQDAMERTSMSHNPSSSGSSDNGFGLDSDFDIDGDCWSDPLSLQSEVSSKPVKIQSVNETEKPVAAPGLLLILLLCGAFVASSKTSVKALPPLPKQLQTASANVLQNIFQDAGVTAALEANRVEVSSDSWVVAKSAVPQMVGLESSLAMLTSQLEKPTAQQQREQLLQLTPAEYNDVTSNNFLREAEPTTQRGRRHIEEGLASMRSNSKLSAAEVYTRSLLWDRVDAEVVRRFAAFAHQAQASIKSEYADTSV
ncbi:hypothetical protein RUND412_001951 [Rhizina undulata]